MKIINFIKNKGWKTGVIPKREKSLFFYEKNGVVRYGFYSLKENCFIEFNTENNKFYKIVGWKYTNIG